jgi:hypothetical protein
MFSHVRTLFRHELDVPFADARIMNSVAAATAVVHVCKNQCPPKELIQTQLLAVDESGRSCPKNSIWVWML